MIEYYRRRRSAERNLTAEQLVKNHAQAVLVAGRPHFAKGTTGLLGRHVGGRAHHRSVLGEFFAGTLQVGQPKIHQERLATAVNHHVGRFYVAVDDAHAVGVVQGIRKIADNPHALVEIERTLFDHFFQRMAFNECCRNVKLRAVAALRHRWARCADDGVVRPPSALAEIWLAAWGSPNISVLRNLQGHLAIQDGIVRPINRAETTDADPRANVKSSQALGKLRRWVVWAGGVWIGRRRDSLGGDFRRYDGQSQRERPSAPFAHGGLAQPVVVHVISLAATGMRTVDLDRHPSDSPQETRRGQNGLLTRILPLGKKTKRLGITFQERAF